MLAMALMLFCVIPLSLMPITKGHDTLFHLQRIDAISEEIKMGNWFSRIYTTTLDGNGYASPLFYGDIFLYIPAFMVAFMDVSLLDSLSFFMILVIVLSAMSMYLCTWSITKSEKSAFLGAILFSLSSYLSTDILQRCALGEAQAFIFLPIVFLGFYNIMYGERRKWYYLPVGLALMLYCHTLSSVMTVLALAMLLVASVKKIKENPWRLLYLCLSVVVFLILTIDFVLPMLEQMGSATFLSTDGFAATKWGSLSRRSMPLWAALFDFNSLTAACRKDWFPNGIGLAGVTLVITYFIYRKEYQEKFTVKLLIIGGIFLFMTTNLFPWKTLQNVAGLIQFPWRFLIFPTFFIALGTALYFNQRNIRRNFKPIVMAIVVLSLFSYTVNGAANYINHYMKGKTETEILKLSENNIGAGEYLPTSDEFERNSKYNDNYQAALIEHAGKIYSDGDLEASFVREDGKLIVTFSNNTEAGTCLDVPLIMYKGYTAYYEDGTELQCDYGMYNRIRVELDGRAEGVITFEYTGTTVQKISRLVNVAGVAALIGFIVFDKCRKKA